MTNTLIERNPEILGGTPVFARTRVPVRILMEHLEADAPLDEFLDDFPTVTREQAVSVLEHAEKAIRDHDTVVFERQDAKAFLDAIVNPPAPRSRTRKASTSSRNACDQRPRHLHRR